MTTTRRYEIPVALLGAYRQYTIPEYLDSVTGVDPDGFCSDPDDAAAILAALRAAAAEDDEITDEQIEGEDHYCSNGHEWHTPEHYMEAWRRFVRGGYHGTDPRPVCPDCGRLSAHYDFSW